MTTTGKHLLPPDNRPPVKDCQTLGILWLDPAFGMAPHLPSPRRCLLRATLGLALHRLQLPSPRVSAASSLADTPFGMGVRRGERTMTVLQCPMTETDVTPVPLALLADRIDQLLPQTQCRRCGYDDCRGYAEALARGDEAINRCPPGRDETIARLARLLDRPLLPLADDLSPMPVRQTVRIDPAHCIGCTKCILACPVDAIVGAPRFMHQVLMQNSRGGDQESGLRYELKSGPKRRTLPWGVGWKSAIRLSTPFIAYMW